MGASDAAWLRHWIYDWGGLNTHLMLWINGSVSAAWIGPARLLSALGSYWGAPWMALLLLGLRRRGGSAAAGLAPFRFVTGVALAMSAAAIVKVALALPRPGDILANELARVVAEPDSLYAFPSGHAVYTAVVIACLWPLGPWPLRVLLLAFGLAVGWSRIALGAHFPMDVLAGFLLGAACVAATGRFARILEQAVVKWEAAR